MTSEREPGPSASAVIGAGASFADMGTSASGQHQRPMAWRVLANIGTNYVIVLVLAALVVIYSIALPSVFPTAATVNSILSVEPTAVFVGLGAMIALVCGQFDLSVGSVSGTVGAVMVVLTSHISFSGAILVGLLLGVLVGLVNAILILVLNVHSFIATLGTGSVLSGITLELTHGTLLNLPASVSLTFFRGAIFGVPYAFLLAVAVVLALGYFLTFVPSGRHFYATGLHRDVARMAGVKVRRAGVIALVMASVLAAAGGILEAGSVGSVESGVGATFLLPAFAAAFLGATAVQAGFFNPIGLLVAAVLLQVGVTGLEEAGVPTWIDPVFNGVVLIIAVAIAIRANRGALRTLS